MGEFRVAQPIACGLCRVGPCLHVLSCRHTSESQKIVYDIIKIFGISKGIVNQGEMVSPLQDEGQYCGAVRCSLVQSCSAVQSRYGSDRTFDLISAI